MFIHHLRGKRQPRMKQNGPECKCIYIWNNSKKTTHAREKWKLRWRWWWKPQKKLSKCQLPMAHSLNPLSSTSAGLAHASWQKPWRRHKTALSARRHVAPEAVTLTAGGRPAGRELNDSKDSRKAGTFWPHSRSETLPEILMVFVKLPAEWRPWREVG